MDYFGMLASFRPAPKEDGSKNFVCLFPKTELKGIGDEQNSAYMGMRSTKICSHKGKRDEHASFPKGLLPIELIKD